MTNEDQLQEAWAALIRVRESIDHPEEYRGTSATSSDEDASGGYTEPGSSERREREAFAKAGNIEAANDLGSDYYWDGDLGQATYWYGKAAESGHAVAQNNLATVYLQQQKSHLALPWLKKAAQAGNENAMMNLSQLLAMEGAFGDALRIIKPLADAGWSEAQDKVGFLSAQLGDMQAAQKYWHLAASQSHEVAPFNLGIFYRQQGHDKISTAWLSLASELGNPYADEVLDSRKQPKGSHTDIWFFVNPQTKKIDAAYCFSILGITKRVDREWVPVRREDSGIDNLYGFAVYQYDWDSSTTIMTEDFDFDDYDSITPKTLKSFDNGNLTVSEVQRTCDLHTRKFGPEQDI